MPFSDARDYQIAILTTFLLLGVYTRDWTLHLAWVLVAIATCIVTQWSLSAWQAYRYRKETPVQWPPLLISGARSAVITGLGLSLLLRVNHPLVLVGAAVGAIASKFLFRYQEKHFFNPANFGIIMALLWTDGAWVSPGQWGTDWWYLLLFFSAAGLVLNRVGRWDTSIAFLGSYGGLEILRNFWLGWSWDVVAHQLTSGSLLLFAFFMLTDPRSIPNGKQGRIFWAISIALLTFVLQHGFYTSTAIFWALFCLAPSTIVIDKIWRSPRFQWQEKSQRQIVPGDTPLTLQTRPVI